VAKGSSFSFDRRGRVTHVRGTAGALVGDAVGEPAVEAIRRLLEACGTAGSPVVRFDARRKDGVTEVSVIDSAASPGAARTQYAFAHSTFDKDPLDSTGMTAS